MKIKNVFYKLKEIYRKLSVPQFTIVTGLIIIIFGTLILSSPICSSSDVGLWEAFFTSTSAITVTGLTIIDVGVDLNIFGQIFLALMLLSGGLGLMAITTFLQGFVVKGTQLRTRLDKGKTLDEFGVGGIGRTFQSIAITATSIISFGAIVLYFFGFLEIQNNWQRLWSAIFHSISAYNNAGFSLWSNSLQDYRSNNTSVLYKNSILNQWCAIEAAIKWDHGKLAKDIKEWQYSKNDKTLFHKKKKLKLKFTQITFYKWTISLAYKDIPHVMPNIICSSRVL